MKQKSLELDEKISEELDEQLKKVCFIWIKKYKLNKRYLNSYYWIDTIGTKTSIHFQLEIGSIIDKTK